MERYKEVLFTSAEAVLLHVYVNRDQFLRASLCKILKSSFAHNMDFAHNFSVEFFS